MKKKIKTIPRKTKKMLENIQYSALSIMTLAMHAQHETNEKERDAIVELISRRNEDIEEQYSTNWH